MVIRGTDMDNNDPALGSSSALVLELSGVMSGAQETRRNFNDSEEYDPFWQRWETVACTSETLRESSQCPPESERRDVTGVEFHQHVAVPLCSPSHPVVPPSTDSHSPARKTLETHKPGPELTRRHQASSPSHMDKPSADPAPHPAPRKPSRSQAGAAKRADAPPPAFQSSCRPSRTVLIRSSASVPTAHRERHSPVAPPSFSLHPPQTLPHLHPPLPATVNIAEQRRGSSKPDCSFHSGPCAKDGRIGNSRVGRRSTLICPERLKDFGAEEYLNGDVKVFKTSVSEPPEVQTSAPQPSNSSRPGFRKHPYSRLSKQHGMEIFLKKELLRYTGSVKERGALYLLSSLKQGQQRKGVIVATDCSFSKAVAYHAVELRVPVFVVMPACCSPPRLRMYRDYGAVVISYSSTARDSISHARHRENGYLCLEEDDSAVYLAGLGTVGLEIYEQVPKLDAVIVPAGGHCGLLAGTAAAIKHLNPRISVIGVEPEEFPLLLQSLKTDSPIKDLYCNPNKKLYRDLVDHSLGTHCFQLAKKTVDKVISVREADALVAMLRFQEYERSTVDTEGAVGLAAILAGQLPELKGKRVAVVVSSANMELDLVLQCVERALVLDDRVSRFTVQLANWPGDMAKLLDLLAREDLRLLDVRHRR
ncbi:L-threonine ammonia-lyase [Sinocyclocheilus anshuiensis]|uniref:L-threonine ammonia-lyase n=1 Tax=Sinocyclocheilus anshuiensis TaxID=1608454 RepID=UPI0007B7CAA8|nr:PREDICTED: L-threonine ammonia-lyase-like [Sinocyclocheilus anshuiensis]